MNKSKIILIFRLGLVADSVIQAIVRPDFEDGLRTGTTVEVITDNHSIRTNPEISVRPWGRCDRFTTVRRGPKNPKPAVVGSVPD